MIVPPAVMSVVPVLVVALDKLSVPCAGALDCDQVSVWPLSGSLTCSKFLMSVALALKGTVKAVPVPTKLGATLGKETVTVALVAAAAVLPAVSVAVPAPMEMPREPAPVIDPSVTVRVRPVPFTDTEAPAVFVALRVMLPAAKVDELKLVSA